MSRPLRVGFAPLLPVTNAATRTFCMDPQPGLVERGIECRTFLPSGTRSYLALYRGTARVRLLRAALYWYGVVLPRRLAQLPRMLRCDVLFVQRALFRYTSPPVLERVVRAIGRPFGLRLILHCDDALYLWRPSYEARFALADRVLTGNEDIESQVRACGGRPSRLEGAVDARRYPVRKRDDPERVVIGWTGHAASFRLAPIVGALARVCASRRVVVKVVADEAPVLPGLEDALVFEKWRFERKFELFVDFDIGVMPLEDNPVNRAKEGFKIKEYMAAGLPVVCSPVGYNLRLVEHEITGLFATDEDDWVDCLTRLVDNAALRRRLGEAGREMVLERYDLPHLVERLATLLQDVAQEHAAVGGGRAE